MPSSSVATSRASGSASSIAFESRLRASVPSWMCVRSAKCRSRAACSGSRVTLRRWPAALTSTMVVHRKAHLVLTLGARVGGQIAQIDRAPSDRTASTQLSSIEPRTRSSQPMAFSVPPLPYAYDALEPHIDKATMEVHHDKHHQAYVDKANAALEGTALADAPIEDVLKDLGAVPEEKRKAVRNNGGGHYNHTLFWESMRAGGDQSSGEPQGELAGAISSAFGSFADLQAKVKEAGVNQFGSGWSWLVRDGSGLAVVGSANQDNPISDGKTPLLGVDVWEHAYYLKYQNRRPDYIDAWWNVVDWSKVAERFAAAG